MTTMTTSATPAAWQDIFSQSSSIASFTRDGSTALRNIGQLKEFLDIVHIRHCLAKPFQEHENYPLVEGRELLPSFDTDMFEYKDLPGFSLVALGRRLDYFSEIFQFDKLHSIPAHDGKACPLESQIYAQNLGIVASRLPKAMQEKLRESMEGKDLTLLDNYHDLLPFLLEMDRAQVIALDDSDLFHLSGIFASFPADMDSELKRFGMRIGKFAYGDSEMYERNRMFVYQYLMELYGFPIVSERRTSSALFARKLHKMGENFLLRVLGQSDRTLTTYMFTGEKRHYPLVEKIALVRVEENQEQAIAAISQKGFFLDEKRRAVILRVRYRQHNYDPSNVRQDRALSVEKQEVLHPLTGKALDGLNIIKDSNNMFLRLNDIIRGEHTGRIVFKRAEIVENTDTDEKRLKFLHSWLAKHQRRMISYSDDFYDNILKVINGYLQSPQKRAMFDSLRELYQEVTSLLSYISQARRIRLLNDMAARSYKGKKIGYRQMCAETVALLNELQFDIVNFFPDLVDAAINSVQTIVQDNYLLRNYINVPENSLSHSGLEIRKNYGRIIALLDAIKAVRKARLSSMKTAEAKSV